MAALGEYRPIGVRMFDSLEFQKLSKDARFALITMKVRLGMAGIDVLLPAQVAHWCGMSLDEAEKAFDELEEAKWIVREESVVWLRNGLKYSPGVSLENEPHVSHMADKLRSLPRLPILAEWCVYYNLAITDIVGDPSPAEWQEMREYVLEKYHHKSMDLRPPGYLPFKKRRTPREETPPQEPTERKAEARKSAPRKAAQSNRYKYETIDMAHARLHAAQLKTHATNDWNGMLAPKGRTEEGLLEKWAHEYRLIRERDRREPADIQLILEHFPSVRFLLNNLHSPGAMRGEYKNGRDKFTSIMSDIRKVCNGTGKHSARSAEKFSRIFTELDELQRGLDEPADVGAPESRAQEVAYEVVREVRAPGSDSGDEPGDAGDDDTGDDR